MPPLTTLVDPFHAVDGMGNCLCGPHLPFSLVRMNPMVCPPHQTNGYSSSGPILGFTHTNVSGTGGLSRYGNIRVTPHGPPTRILNHGALRRDETASPGFYGVTLLPEGIGVELTSTPRCGVHRYRFPEGLPAYLLIDAGSIVQPPSRSVDPNGAPPVCIGGFVEALSDTEVIGRGDFRGGWGHTHPYSVYFYARSDRPFRRASAGNSQGLATARHAFGPGSAIDLDFGPIPELNLRVGISYASIAKARASVDRECADLSFDALRDRASATWESWLSRISTRGGSDEQRLLFYTLFTRLLCMPSDLGIDDEFDRWHSGVCHFSDYYCLWDSVRNANSLLTLFSPEIERDQLNCLLDIADHTGWLPDAWIAGHSAMVQGGSSADILLCEAHLKGLDGIDYEKALRHMRKNSEVPSPDPYHFGRHLPEYRDKGFLSTAVRKNGVSRHMEYAYQDWCASTLAARLGHSDLSETLLESSRKLWNLWRDDLRCFAPRQPDGRWVDPFNPASSLPDSWNDPYFYEGTSRQWSFNTQHDFAGLVARHGGPDAFIRHLDAFFADGQHHAKETMLHVPWLYHYAGRPDLSAARVRQVLRDNYKPTRDGLRDNEDMGCQSAFYMCSSLGLYPLMGQDLYWIIAPVFDHIDLQLGESGKHLVIETEHESSNSLHITRAELNGVPLDRPWLRHADIANPTSATQMKK